MAAAVRSRGAQHGTSRPAATPGSGEEERSSLVDSHASRATSPRGRGAVRGRLLGRFITACFPCVSCCCPSTRTASATRSGCGTRDSHLLWLNLDACGLFTAGAVWLIVLSCYSMMMHAVFIPALGASPAGIVNAVVWTALPLLGLVSHTRAMLSNPGAVPVNAKPVDPADWSRSCARCAGFKPARAHHCSVCGRCVVKMDHHCPWINNCVGMANQKFFILFLVYICTMCCYGFAWWVYWFSHCIAAAGGACSEAAASPWMLIEMIVCLVQGILFGLFTGCLFVDQVTVMLTNQTQIDRLKGTPVKEDAGTDSSYDRLRVWHNLGEVFGGDPARDGFQLTWLLPTSITYPDIEALTGYCFRDTPKPRSEAEMEEMV